MEDIINSPDAIKYKEFQISSREKIVILKFRNNKFLSYISKENYLTSLKIYKPLITASYQEIIIY